MIPCRHISVTWPEINTLLIPFFKDTQVGVSDSRLDISTNNELKWDIYTSNLSLGVDNQKQITDFENGRLGYCFMAF